MTTLREAATMALAQLKINRTNFRKGPSKSICKMLAGGNDEAIADLEAALAEPTVKESLTTGSCIACGNRMTGSPESFVVATAEVGVTAPEGYSPQQVEALHQHKVGDKTSPPLQEPTVAENATTQQQLEDMPPSDYRRGYWDGFNIGKREGRIEAKDALAEPVQEPVAWVECDGDLVWNNRDAAIGRNLYTAPPQRKENSDE